MIFGINGSHENGGSGRRIDTGDHEKAGMIALAGKPSPGLGQEIYHNISYFKQVGGTKRLGSKGIQGKPPIPAQGTHRRNAIRIPKAGRSGEGRQENLIVNTCHAC